MIMEMDALLRTTGPASHGAFHRASGPSTRLTTVLVLVTGAFALALADRPATLSAQTPPGVPSAALAPASAIRLPGLRDAPTGPVDSNSPLVWTLTDGDLVLHVLTSIDGHASHASGPSIAALSESSAIAWASAALLHGAWMEAVIAAADGTWYGYYHNEIPPSDCPGSAKIEPRLGAARSMDEGRTWTDLGIVLAAPRATATCGTRNEYFVGGVGDFSAVLDADGQYLYLVYSQYIGDASTQGIAVGRMVWADRDEPVGRVSVWHDGAWILPSLDEGPGQFPDEGPVTGDREGDQPGGEPEDDPKGDTSPPRWIFPVATPIFPTSDSWHDGQTATAFWGPSVHWNTHLEQYVMLLNRTRTVRWDLEGIYVSFASRLDDPRAWSTPRRLLAGGRWYPQVAGIEAGTGTDKHAGQTARFFMSGRSDHVIVFNRP